MAAKGSYVNPVTRSCFVGCASCHRCEKRAHDGCPFPTTCSGRPDVEGMRDPHPDDLCQCKTGVLRWVTKEQRVIIRRFKSSPFGGQIKTDTQDQADHDWNAYLNEKRNQIGDPNYDPVQFADGSSTTDYFNKVYQQ